MMTNPTHEAASAAPEPGEGSIGEEDLLHDPSTDVEALCLCALLWTTASAARRVVDALTSEDFADPIYGRLFAEIADQVGGGAPHDPASMATHITETGKAGGHHGFQLRRALADATTAGADPSTAGHYARAVSAAAYRRGFHTAAAAITQAAEELPQDQLFEHLLTVGRERRAATERLQHINTTLR